MTLRWIFVFLLLAMAIDGLSQLRERTNSNVRLNSLAMVNATSHLKGAGDYCGIYRSEQDRRLRKLSLVIDCKSEDHKIRPGFVRDKAAIKIIRRNQTQRFMRRDISGYRDCQGNEYHFFEGKTYELINPDDGISLYRIYQQKGKQREAKVFFTTRAGDLRPLSLDNLSTEFSDEPLFLEKLRILATNDFELIKYMHALNRVRDTANETIEEIEDR